MERPVNLLLAAVSVVMLGVSVAFGGLPEYRTAVTSEPSIFSYYQFDSNDATDSISAYNGVLMNSPGFVTGVGGGTDLALSLDGTNWVTVGTVAAPIEAFAFWNEHDAGTVELWFQTAWSGSAGKDLALASCRNGECGAVRYSLHVGGDRGFLIMYSCAAGVVTTIGPNESPAEWHHVAFAFKDDLMRVYMDGRPCGISNRWGIGQPLGWVDPRPPFEIGASVFAGSNGENFRGLIDEVAVYSDALSGGDIIAHWKAFQPPGLSLTPESASLRLPDNTTAALTLGLPAPAGPGGLPVRLEYNESIFQISLSDGTPIGSYDTILVPQGVSSVPLTLTAFGVSNEAVVVASSPPLTEGITLITVANGGELTMTPNPQVFTYPGSVGPQDVTIGTAGIVAGAGGIPIALTYDPAVIAVTTSGGTPIATGGTVTVPQGSSDVLVKVSAVGPGFSDLTASNSAFTRVVGKFHAAGYGNTSAALQAYQTTVKAESSLISYYTFDSDTAATGVHDEAPAAYHYDGVLAGTVANAQFLGRKEGGQTLQLFGHAYVNCGPRLELAFPGGQGTVEAWIRPDWVAAAEVTWGGDAWYDKLAVATSGDWSSSGWMERYAAYVDTDRTSIGSVVRDGTRDSREWGTYQLTQDRWYHVAYVYGADNTLRMYVDGTEVKNVSYQLGLPDGTGAPVQNFLIGTSDTEDGGTYMGWDTFVGGIDELAVYNQALTATKIRQHLMAFRASMPGGPTSPSAALTAYQAAVQGTPSLLSYYNFEGANEAASLLDKKDGHNGTKVGTLSWTEGVSGGKALLPVNLSGTGGYVALGNVNDFKFADGTGTIESWIAVGGINAGLGYGSYFSGADDSTTRRYATYVNSNTGAVGIDAANYIEGPGGQLGAQQWAHVTTVFSNDGEGVNQRTSVYLNGVPVIDNATQTLGSDISSFQIGVAEPLGSYAFLGQIDELAVYADPLTPSQVAAHYSLLALNLSPSQYQFTLPASPGPLAVTLSMPTGAVAPTGGLAVTLTYNAELIAVSTGGTPISSGGQIIIPAGANTASLSVTALSPGTARLQAAATGQFTGSATFAIQSVTSEGLVYVDDHFGDNPAWTVTDYGPAIGRNPTAAGAGWNTYSTGKTQRERGTDWAALADGGGWALSEITGKGEDEFPVMTADGVAVEWVIDNARVMTDNAAYQPQFVGGATSDCRHEFGVVSAHMSNYGDAELYNNNRGGLYVSLFYEANEGSPDDIQVTGNLRVVNSTHPAGQDSEGAAGLETVATFTLPGLTGISPANPLVLTMRVKQSGWEIAFSENAQAQFNVLTAGAHLKQGRHLVGGWDSTTLNDAAITTEFNDGAFLTALVQNVAGGLGSASVDRVKACSGCLLSTDCQNDPFADADLDGDVDQDDFGLLQRCYSGSGNPVPFGCECLDIDSNQSIDDGDVAVFQQCASQSGPTITAPKNCDD